MSQKSKQAVRVDHIEDPRQFIRMRPTAYIPSTGKEGMIHLIYEIVDNSIDEALNVKWKPIIKIIINEDERRVTVIDNGRGIPLEDLETATTKPQSSGKYYNEEDGEGYRASGGTNGLGLKLNVFLSKEFTITSMTNGKSKTLVFKDGILVDTIHGKSKESGTVISFILDDKYIDTDEFSYDDIVRTLKLKSYAYPEVEFNVIKILKGAQVKSKTYKNKGLKEGVEELMKPDLPVITIEGKKKVTVLNHKLKEMEDHTVHVQLALSMKEALLETKDQDEFSVSFANSIVTTMGGSHVQGLREGLVKFFKQATTAGKQNVTPTDIIAGLTSFIVIQMSKPEYRSQHKDQLNSEAARIAVRDIVYDALSNEKESTIKKYITFIKEAAKSREAAKKSRNKTVKTSFSKDFISKYSPILENDKTYKRELYACEGDSVLGSLMQARDINIHAVLPLSRASNTIDMKYSDLSNVKSSFHDLMSVCGIELGKKFSREDLNFDKIILALDGDVDGDGMSAAHTGLIAVFVPQLIEWDMVYRLVPPLYKFKDKKGNMVYLTSQKELFKYIGEDFAQKNSISVRHTTLKSKDIIKYYDINFYYAKELDKLVKKIKGSPLLLERLIWNYNDKVDYKKSDIKFFKDVLKPFPYIEIEWVKGSIVIKGVAEDVPVHIIVNKHFSKSIKRFKVIQDKNLTVYGHKLNGEKSSTYQIIKEIEKFMPTGIDRIKGLGELNAVEFRAQCMDPKRRKLIKMEFSDNPKKDLEKILLHHSSKAHYVAMRKHYMSQIVFDEEELDT